MLAGEDVPELAGLLLEPGDRLRIGDLALPVRDLVLERRVLRRQGSHLRVEVAALRDLTVDGKGDETADPGDEHDREPAQGQRTVDAWTLGGTDGATLCSAPCETNGTMWRRVSSKDGPHPRF